MQSVSVLGREAIFVGSDCTSFIAKKSLELTRSSTLVFICDENVAPLHLDHLINAFETKARILRFIIPAGESSKNRHMKETIEDFLLTNTCTRDTTLIALGGGVVGFVASTFMRGVPVIQIPTTLLAMVDSSIGGKTAVDTPHGKNLIGAFHQPLAIFIDIAYLKTLPKRQFINGMAEVIKTAAIWSAQDFELLENNSQSIIPTYKDSLAYFDQELVVKVILGSARVKAFVVSNDEKESGLRSLLNFGHSIGHAIEAILAPEVLHGECIAVGMAREAEVAKYMGYLDDVSYGRLCRCLSTYGLAVSLTDKNITRYATRECQLDTLMEFMKIDKKNLSGQKRLVILSGIGSVAEKNALPVDDDVIRKTLSLCLHVSPGANQNVHVSVPGSKSISNRALLMAALGKGTCRLHGLLFSDDVHVMLDALQRLAGISYSWEEKGKVLVINGSGGKLVASPNEIYLGNAGTAARFITTVCTLISQGEPTIITGNARMKQRPIGPLVEALSANGCQIQYLESTGCLPLKISSGGLQGGVIKLSASVSSQYVSSILISAPYAKNPVILDLSGDDVVSQPYIDMTIAMMKGFGVHVERDGNTYKIPNIHYRNPTDYHIEGDASSATYPLAFAAMHQTTVTVDNVGSDSLQGDAEFSIKVLKAMGCHVIQTPKTTTVTGPKKLVGIPHIDMETMTDAFLTASVLAAVATGETNIVGIANQRVKECNRIAAMVEQLGEFGVEASELEDGIRVVGTNASSLSRGSGVHCYDDHRIAMSFSLLASVTLKGATITEKRCVEKTWPSWWIVLQNKLGAKVKDIEHKPILQDSANCIALIGMRGAGKSHLGKIAADALKKDFIDMDVYFEETVKMTIPEFIEQHGWKEFRSMELACLTKVLETAKNTIIATGGGIIETPAAVALLKSKCQVVHIKRDLNDVYAYLSADLNRPALQNDFFTSWKMREPFYKDCSHLEFVIPSHENIPEYWTKVNQAFIRFLSPKPTITEPSFFLSLTFEDIKEALPIMDTISEGVHALELRVDLLKELTESYVAEQLGLIRLHSKLPIIFTIRSTSQGGKSTLSWAETRSLIQNAFRWSCEFVDIEVDKSLSEDLFALLSLKNKSQIIASYHDVQGLNFMSKYEELEVFGDIVKLIGKAKTFTDNLTTVNYIKTLGAKKPLIIMLMGEHGKLSRALNLFLTPVTHPLLPFVAAPGQLSVAEIHQLRAQMGMFRKRDFYLFGTPIQASLSPILHNSGFQRLGLPHQYHLCETDSIEKVKQVISTPTFGGASVTIPLKVDVVPLCHELSDAAKSIGAVNTLTLRKGKLYGDNTDWLGIKACFEAPKDAMGLVIGAGGTARAALYALKGLKTFIWNRTHSKAASLAQEFGATALQHLQLPPCSFIVVISTIPASAQTELDLKSIFLKDSAGIIIDMAYRPKDTCLLLAAPDSFKKVPGVQVLIQQGYHQFRQWTKCEPPHLEQVVYNAYE